MSAVSLLRRVFAKQIADFSSINAPVSCYVQKRLKFKLMQIPEPGVKGKSWRRTVHFKDEYTVEPLKVTHLGGRDPVTGRVVAKALGGGLKHKYHWIHWFRDGPTDLTEKPKLNKVLAVFKDGCRTANVALVGSGPDLKYILATENMKVGDILKSHKGIPRNPVRAMEGDAYPLGALPLGTLVNCVEKYPGQGGLLINAAGTCGVITGSDGDDRMIVKMPSKQEFSLHKTCMATVGRLSNVEHESTPVGSAQKMRELGNRPRSGLWQRKTGRFGRKIRKLPPVRRIGLDQKVQTMELLDFTHKKLF
ncbi:mitochondrial ribosomal protein L2 [Lasioglossum baleicum]|uniref:mitochondrial ribosomal protein L2 n=1 Tax=Lasioglossum baleicum TaxID=434251 RepID=UPI003FCED890